MEAEVRVEAENPIVGGKTHTNNAYIVYVALGDDGKPVTIPPISAETPEEQQRLDEARQRQIRRLKK
jgi:acyl-CoA hydrolase